MITLKYRYELYWPNKPQYPPFVRITVEFGTTEMGVDDTGDFSAVDTSGITWHFPKGQFGMIKLVPIPEDELLSEAATILAATMAPIPDDVFVHAGQTVVAGADGQTVYWAE